MGKQDHHGGFQEGLIISKYLTNYFIHIFKYIYIYTSLEMYFSSGLVCFQYISIHTKTIKKKII